MFGIEDFSQKIVDFSNFEPSQLLDAATFGGAILLIGMLIVFSVLIIILAALSLFKVFFHDLKMPKKEKTDAPVEAAPVAAVKPASADDEVIAAIAAAIAMAESESSGLKFRVVSFKRK